MSQANVDVSQSQSTAEQPFLVFGYGSLIWRPPPHVARRVPGYITTHLRRFWQLSQDHRGTVDRPGRVVTLIPRSTVSQFSRASESYKQEDGNGNVKSDRSNIKRIESERCWGAVYEIVPESVAEVTAYLTQREINGYSRLEIPVHTTEGILNAYVFIGEADNPQFSPFPDDADGMQAIAEHIARSEGPSGRNDEYLFNLEKSLRSYQQEAKANGNTDAVSDTQQDGCGDWYVDELVRLVKASRE